MENIEKRFIKEIRATNESRLVEGTAIVFNSPSVYMGFTEVIKPEAITQELLNSSDIIMLFNHEDDQVPLARSKNGKGSLKILLTDIGVEFSFSAKKTSSGDEILEAIRQGDLDACSFAFCVAEGGETWEKLPDGTYLRTITKIELLKDFSIVVDPAYASTTVNTRGLDELKQKEELSKELELRENLELEKQKLKEQEEQETQRKIEEDKKYWGRYDEVLTKYKNLG